MSNHGEDPDEAGIQSGTTGQDDVQPYRVGNRRPPLHTRFRKGVSGNPRGRPKRQPSFHERLLAELRREVEAMRNGKKIRKSHLDLFVSHVVKNGITTGPQAARLLHALICQAEAAEAEALAEAEARKKQLEIADPPFSWGEEQEKLYRELQRLEAPEASASTEAAHDSGPEGSEG